MLASLVFDAVLTIPATQRKKPVSVLDPHFAHLKISTKRPEVGALNFGQEPKAVRPGAEAGHGISLPPRLESPLSVLRGCGTGR